MIKFKTKWLKNLIIIFTIHLFIFSNHCKAQQLTRNEYIKKFAPLAVQQMHIHNIPASITLAQGILESNNGNSRLAIKGNNHFGIKCHGWEGKKIYEDDDKKNECFRSYKSVIRVFYRSFSFF